MDNGNGYITRINRVIDHLNANLRSAYSLDELAEVACFSPYHFHRVFKSITGETVHEYAKRLRLEKAARLAADNKFKMAEIAVECGFESTTDLSRSFKARFGVPPSRFTRNAWLKHTRGDELAPQLKIVGLQQAEAPRNTHVEICDKPAQRIAYLRIVGAYEPANFMRGWEEFSGWAVGAGVMDKGTLLGMSQDDPDITPWDKYRYDMCLTVAKDVRPEGNIGIRVLPAQRYVRLTCQGDIQEVARAWDWLFRQWLPQSEWQPADGYCIEEYVTNPIKSGWETFDLAGLVPVKWL
jgi:AraC family transcriptional regulator